MHGGDFVGGEADFGEAFGDVRIPGAVATPGPAAEIFGGAVEIEQRRISQRMGGETRRQLIQVKAKRQGCPDNS